jgi:hypothetical protein
MMLRTAFLALAMAFVSAPLAAQDIVLPAEPSEKPELALFGTIPIMWGEAASFEDLVRGRSQPHWARAALEQSHHVRALDTLAQEDGAATMQSGGTLLMAQPRALSGVENVALDDWVRGGGHLLLFADPMMTGESLHAFGDRRRAQDVILLSPILARWGLALSFDADQPEGDRLVELDDALALPVNLAGTFAPGNSGFEAACELEADGLIADCTIGEGRALIVADAALLDLHAGDQSARAASLNALLGRLTQAD